MSQKFNTLLLLLFGSVISAVIEAKSVQQVHWIRDHYDDIVKPGTYDSAHSLDHPEYRVAYFREDIALGLCHKIWHTIYPSFGDNKRIININRRGELFYYFHQQLGARYNVERLSNDLNLTETFDWYKPIPEGYFHMIDPKVTNLTYYSREPNMRLKIDDRIGQNLKTTRDRIYEAIDSKTFKTSNNSEINIDNDQGIDIVASATEAINILSPDFSYYGNLHRQGHFLIAQINDPELKFKDLRGLMLSFSLAVRDPVFFKWHAFVDSVFYRHKDSLSSYTEQNLKFDGIKVNSVNVVTSGSSDVNVLETSMTRHIYNASKGLDFEKEGHEQGPMLLTLPHITHTDFVYKIRVNNTSGKPLNGTVRIFIAPARGYRNISLTLREQRKLMLQMDRFVATVQPGNDVLIVRNSTDSSLTVPRQQMYKVLNGGGDLSESNDYSHCGLPHHMLLPLGTPEGYPMVLFVMISDYEQDKVDDQGQLDSTESARKLSSIFCGVKNRLYPDRRPMGYPFDRPIAEEITSVQEFASRYDNMAITPLEIKFMGVKSGIDV